MGKKKKSKGRGFSTRGKHKENAKKKERQGSGLGFGLFKPPPGSELEMFKIEAKKGKKKATVRFNFLAYEVTVDTHKEVEKGEFWYTTSYKRHTNIGSEEKNYVCLQTIGKRCPICEYRSSLMKNGGDEDEIAALKAKDRELFLPVVDGVVKLLDMSPYMFGHDLVDAVNDEDEDNLAIGDDTDGTTVVAKFKQKMFNKNAFYEVTDISFEDRDDDFDEDVLEQVVDLDKLLVICTYDKLEAILMETEDSLDDDEDEEDEEVKPKKKKSTKKKPVVEDDDDEDEEEVKPKKSSKKKAKGGKFNVGDTVILDGEEVKITGYDDGEYTVEDSDGDEEDEIEEDELSPVKEKKSSKKKSSKKSKGGKFKVGDTVILDDEEVEVVAYDEKSKEYTVKDEDGVIEDEIEEDELEAK